MQKTMGRSKMSSTREWLHYLFFALIFAGVAFNLWFFLAGFLVWFYLDHTKATKEPTPDEIKERQ